MNTSIVLTLTGPDRVGIVEDVAEALLGLGANVENSRMARLGGEFAILMLVSLPSERAGEVERALGHLASAGYKVTTSETSTASDAFAGWSRYRVDVSGADHEGIVREIAAGLSQRGINIESAETGTTSAATTGVTLFTMSAVVLVPPSLVEEEWMAALAEAGADANVDIEVSIDE